MGKRYSPYLPVIESVMFSHRQIFHPTCYLNVFKLSQLSQNRNDLHVGTKMCIEAMISCWSKGHAAGSFWPRLLFKVTARHTSICDNVLKLKENLNLTWDSCCISHRRKVTPDLRSNCKQERSSSYQRFFSLGEHPALPSQTKFLGLSKGQLLGTWGARWFAFLFTCTQPQESSSTT